MGRVTVESQVVDKTVPLAYDPRPKDDAPRSTRRGDISERVAQLPV